MYDIYIFFQLKSKYFLLWFLSLQTTCRFQCCKKTTTKNNQFLNIINIDISYSLYLIKQSFKGYPCASDIGVFAWRVTLNLLKELLCYKIVVQKVQSEVLCVACGISKRGKSRELFVLQFQRKMAA